MVRSSNEFCGWCESCFTEEDLFHKRYKTLKKQDFENWKVCLHCLARFASIKSKIKGDIK
tara:strand:- start:39 stop:218 length:180 start_codon:yes stop_codon:yes gene_type:complete